MLGLLRGRLVTEAQYLKAYDLARTLIGKDDLKTGSGMYESYKRDPFKDVLMRKFKALPSVGPNGKSRQIRLKSSAWRRKPAHAQPSYRQRRWARWAGSDSVNCYPKRH